MNTKCKSCGKLLYVGYCFECDGGCIEAYLDSLIDSLDDGKVLGSKEITFLKILKLKRPDIAGKFPRLLKNIKSGKPDLEILRNEFQGRKFKLKKWSSPKNNPGWHDHCEICHKEISNSDITETQAYVGENRSFWICENCFDKYGDKLELVKK